MGENPRKRGKQEVPALCTPDFLLRVVALIKFVRLSLRRVAYVVVSSTAMFVHFSLKCRTPMHLSPAMARHIIFFYASELNTPKLNLYRRRKTFCQTQESLDRVYQRLSTLLRVFNSLPTANQGVAQVSILRPGMGKSRPLCLKQQRALRCHPLFALFARFFAGRRIAGCKPQHSRTTSRRTGKVLK
jgi:hypothetical protein